MLYGVEYYRKMITNKWVRKSSIFYDSGSQPVMLHVPPGNVYVTGVPLV
jgi:hypothetical protein